MATDNMEHAREQAKAQYESIAEMMARLEHARECDGDIETCEFMQDWEGLAQMNMDFEEYHDEDAAQRAIDEDPLSVEVRSDWHTPGDEGDASEFCILLCTGGPAVRIRGSLDQYKQPSRAYLQCQDWGTAWHDFYAGEGSGDVLMNYASHFWYGE